MGVGYRVEIVQTRYMAEFVSQHGEQVHPFGNFAVHSS